MAAHIEYELTPINEATDAILGTIKNSFLKDLDEAFLEPQIEKDIENYLSVLKDDLYCLIEYPYVDKVYRDSFYNYYSSKHYTYSRDCIRVSIFKNEIKEEDFINTANHAELKEKYLGFFIIRPTINALFGRAIINPLAFEVDDFRICKCRTNTFVFGVNLETEGFPHSSQDGESIKCAETTIWGLMEYFANRYIEYKPTLPTKIHKVLEKITYQRQLPSIGLSMEQISYALKEFGFGTRIYSSETYDLNNIIDCYVESGIPVLAGLESSVNQQGHVIIVVGKKYSDDINFSKIKTDTLKARGKDVKYIDYTDIPAKYVVQDDNLEPYRLIELNNPGEHYEEEDVDAKAYEIDAIIVPLYSKIYLEAVIAKELFLQIIKADKVGYDFPDNFIFRYFLASSRSFKNHISNLTDIDADLKISILISKMPKFIWCSEFYTIDNFNSKTGQKASGIVILDATEANKVGIDALIFAGYPDRCVSMNENNFVNLDYKFENYTYFSNLK